MKYFDKVKDYLIELEYEIVHEDKEEYLFIVDKEDKGIKNLILDCEDEILIMEQHLFNLSGPQPEIYKELLQKNTEIIHGAFAIDETGSRVVFRDTLQLENLDLNEIEGSMNSLAFLLSEYSERILKLSQL
ncbi:MAG: YbjN domain-containing protein [Hyphomicrobiales bacterium]